MNRYIQEANQQFISAYNRYPIILDHGEGMYLYDIDGKRYLDFGSGIGVCGLGYHDPNYTRMLQRQIEKLLHTSNLFLMFQQLKLLSSSIKLLIWNKFFLQIPEQKRLKEQLKSPRSIIF